MVLAVQALPPIKAGHAVKAVVAVVAAIPAAWVVMAARAGAARVAGVAVLRGSTSQQVVEVMAAMVML